MPLRPTRRFNTPDFRLLHGITTQLDGRPATDDSVLDAVGWLAETYDPQRADRLRPRPGEPAVLVERLAAFLLRRVPAEAAPHAQRLLDGRPPRPTEAAILRDLPRAAERHDGTATGVPCLRS